MSQKQVSKSKKKRARQASLFAALGDETRLALLGRLCEGRQVSITQLASDSELSRQAITKHLRVLERAGIVQGVRCGRETLFEFHPKPLSEAAGFLGSLTNDWEVALRQLKAFVQRTSG